ncbi:Udp-arabinose 4-epimerase [Thalictrum thalictroides]|uniref:Udp-arabinose 4-epimerase n=1 Tax=Thalictrum thalictroides TaxID=46969 RepID=A0A7J6XDX1_THATH|nr:Udp-arabinose 4-epimerase [Thalictrum thalictroides]
MEEDLIKRLESAVYCLESISIGSRPSISIDNGDEVPVDPANGLRTQFVGRVVNFVQVAWLGLILLHVFIRYFNVIGSDPEGRLGEAPRPELQEHGHICGACFDAAAGTISSLKVNGTDYNTPENFCKRLH